MTSSDTEQVTTQATTGTVMSILEEATKSQEQAENGKQEKKEKKTRRRIEKKSTQQKPKEVKGNETKDVEDRRVVIPPSSRQPVEQPVSRPRQQNVIEEAKHKESKRREPTREVKTGNSTSSTSRVRRVVEHIKKWHLYSISVASKQEVGDLNPSIKFIIKLGCSLLNKFAEQGTLSTIEMRMYRDMVYMNNNYNLEEQVGGKYVIPIPVGEEVNVDDRREEIRRLELETKTLKKSLFKAEQKIKELTHNLNHKRNAISDLNVKNNDLQEQKEELRIVMEEHKNKNNKKRKNKGKEGKKNIKQENSGNSEVDGKRKRKKRKVHKNTGKVEVVQSTNSTSKRKYVGASFSQIWEKGANSPSFTRNMRVEADNMSVGSSVVSIN